MIVPAMHRILIRADKLEEVDTAYLKAKKIGLEIPLSEETKSRAQAGVDKGKVVAVGPTAFRDFGMDNFLKEGDYVGYARFAGKIIKDPYTEDEFVLLNDEDIVCVFHED